MEQRFAAMTRPAEQGPCLLWIGAKDRDGYGVIGGPRINGKNRQWRAHVYAWTLAHGPVPEGHFVLHHCDVRQCVNAHGCLFVGTNQDNMDDMNAKGRGRYPGNPTRGQNKPGSKLTDSQVRAIRSLHGSGARRADVAAAFGVSVGTIKQIWAGTSWRHLLD